MRVRARSDPAREIPTPKQGDPTKGKQSSQKLLPHCGPGGQTMHLSSLSLKGKTGRRMRPAFGFEFERRSDTVEIPPCRSHCATGRGISCKPNRRFKVRVGWSIASINIIHREFSELRLIKL